MFRSRLALKITLLIVAVLIVGFGVSTIVTIRRESAALVEQNKQAARRLTQAVVASIEAAMLQERPDVTRSLIQELRELRARPVEDASPLESLMIYRRNGVEAFTDMAHGDRGGSQRRALGRGHEEHREDAAGAGHDDDGSALHAGARDPHDAGVAGDRQRRLPLHDALSNPQQGKVSGLPRQRSQGSGGRAGRDLDGACLRRGQAPPESAAPHRGADDPGRRRRPDGGDELRRRTADRRALGGGPAHRRRRLRGAGAGRRARRDRRPGRRVQRHDVAALSSPLGAGDEEQGARDRAPESSGVAPAAGAPRAAEGRAREVRARRRQEAARAESERDRAPEADGRGLGGVPRHRRATRSCPSSSTRSGSTSSCRRISRAFWKSSRAITAT